MRFTQESLDLVLKLFGVCAFGLSLVAAWAQDAPKQETHGIAVANMDRSVKPGDNFYLIRQRRLDQAHRNTARPGPVERVFGLLPT